MGKGPRPGRMNSRRHVDVYLGTQRYAQEKGDWDCVIDEFPDLFAEIRRLRIERAKRLLLDTDLPLKQFAHVTGFGTPVHMYQVFRSFVHASPSEFRAAGATNDY